MSGCANTAPNRPSPLGDPFGVADAREIDAREIPYVSLHAALPSTFGQDLCCAYLLCRANSHTVCSSSDPSAGPLATRRPDAAL
eukprot:scaffold1780_cov245-Pinguiococcus_pyrenoidosus.AAC.1